MLERMRKWANEEYANRWLIAAILLNSGDALGTYVAVTHGATEMNPVMAAILKMGMALFFLDKLLIVNFVILAVGLVSKQYRVGRVGLMFASMVYACLIVYHVVNLVLLSMTSGLQ